MVMGTLAVTLSVVAVGVRTVAVTMGVPVFGMCRAMRMLGMGMTGPPGVTLSVVSRLARRPFHTGARLGGRRRFRPGHATHAHAR